MIEVPAVGPNARGEGPPYAPQGFTWGVGCRSTTNKYGQRVWMDRYMWPPGVEPVLKKGVYMASKVQVEACMKRLEPAADLTDLWTKHPWHIPAVSEVLEGEFFKVQWCAWMHCPILIQFSVADQFSCILLL